MPKFSKSQLAGIRQRFDVSNNKTRLAEEIGIISAYFYRIELNQQKGY